MEKTTTNTQGGKGDRIFERRVIIKDEGRSRSRLTMDYEDKVGRKCNYGINYDRTATPNNLLSFRNEVEGDFVSEFLLESNPAHRSKEGPILAFRRGERKKKGGGGGGKK